MPASRTKVPASQETLTTSRNLRRRELPRLRLRARSRRIDDDGLETRKLRRQERATEQVAGFGRDATQPGVARAARSSAASEPASASTACTSAPSARRKAKGPQPAKRSATRAQPRQASTTMRREPFLARAGRLQEGAGRRHDLRPSHRDRRRPPLDDDLAVQR